jgi:hypothetical protein
VSGYNYSDPENDQFEGGSGGGLRKLLEEALAENKKLVERLTQKDREKSTTDLLKEKGLDPAIAELIPADTDPAAWVDKYSHLLGVPKNTPDPEPQAPEVTMPDDSDPALVAEREALAAMRASQEEGSPAVVTSDVLAQMEKINDPKEFEDFLRANGGLSADI